MSHDTSPSVEIIVHEFISSRLREKGFNGWSPREIRSTVLSQTERDRVQGSLRRLTEELVSLSGDQIKEMSDRLASSIPFSTIDYTSFEATAAELFADGIRWSHILTLLVFASELAYSQGLRSSVSQGTGSSPSQGTEYSPSQSTEYSASQASSASQGTGSSDSITNVADCCSQFISSPPLLSWINDHGGWEGLVTYENERNSSDENDHGGDNAPGGPRLGPETSSNALIGLGGAISMVLAGITYLVARH